MYQKILVPLDGSALAEAVLPHVEGMAQANDSEVVLLRVLPNDPREYAMTDPTLLGVILDDDEKEAEHYLTDLKAQLTKRGLKVTAEIVEGDIAECIVKIAAQEGVDLIAMSTHGRSGVERWLIGSVAARVVPTSPVPILLLKPSPTK